MLVSPTVVNVHKECLRKRGFADFNEWLQQPNALYIGRNVRFVQGTFQSKWHNPFRVGNGRQLALDQYEHRIRTIPELFRSLHELSGKELGCWDDPKPCHGNILVKLFNEQFFPPKSI
jgi:hypothetical protein